MNHFRDKHFKRKLIRLSKVKISFFSNNFGNVKEKNKYKKQKKVNETDFSMLQHLRVSLLYFEELRLQKVVSGSFSVSSIRCNSV